MPMPLCFYYGTDQQKQFEEVYYHDIAGACHWNDCSEKGDGEMVVMYLPIAIICGLPILIASDIQATNMHFTYMH